MPTPIADLIAALQEEIEAEEGARDSYEPSTLPHEYHDGRVDGLRWVLEYLAEK